ncbi:hypothetical protein PanWU01x14_004070 [Parasponia andersonii]|uniref:RNase H type-1 domain-containing protein n=1 Tax=Parasponia andersonii TaxID=3476 RepID=A0A2P5E368_PARAD|nr:hypothetical protein PanWU01x14_004070 [Parasponia andersonii]
MIGGAAVRDVFAVGAAVAVARDDRSTFLALRTSQLLNPDPLLSEANSMLLGFQLARDHRFRNVIVESDCLHLVTCWNDGTEEPWNVKHILDQMRRLRPDFSSIVVSSIPRSCNFVPLTYLLGPLFPLSLVMFRSLMFHLGFA